MPGDCTVTHSERTTHLGLRGDLKLPCLLIPFQPHPILFAAHRTVPRSAILHRASSNLQSERSCMRDGTCWENKLAWLGYLFITFTFSGTDGPLNPQFRINRDVFFFSFMPLDNFLNFSSRSNYNAIQNNDPGGLSCSAFASFLWGLVYLDFPLHCSTPTCSFPTARLHLQAVFINFFHKAQQNRGRAALLHVGGEHSPEHCPWTSPHLHPPVL